MTTNKANLILHPIRLRIVTEVATRQLTTTAIAAALPDVPRATLYRQMKRLVDGGVLEVVSETQVKGAVERTYQLSQEGGRLSATDLGAISAQEHLRLFTVFVATLIDTFAEYVNVTPPETVVADGLAYNHALVHLSAAERLQYQEELNALAGRMLALPPAAYRQRYTLAQVVVPAPHDKNEQA